MPSYQEFRESPRGRAIADLARRSIGAMEALSMRGEPAVAAIDSAVAQQVGNLDKTERQHAGRIVRDVLMVRGWRPNPVRKRLAQGRAFTSGAVYAQIGSGSATNAGAADRDWSARVRARADEAVAMLARGRTGNAESVDDFIAERRAEALRDEA